MTPVLTGRRAALFNNIGMKFEGQASPRRHASEVFVHHQKQHRRFEEKEGSQAHFDNERSGRKAKQSGSTYKPQ